MLVTCCLEWLYKLEHRNSALICGTKYWSCSSCLQPQRLWYPDPVTMLFPCSFPQSYHSAGSLISAENVPFLASFVHIFSQFWLKLHLAQIFHSFTDWNCALTINQEKESSLPPLPWFACHQHWKVFKILYDHSAWSLSLCVAAPDLNTVWCNCDGCKHAPKKLWYLKLQGPGVTGVFGGSLYSYTRSIAYLFSCSKFNSNVWVTNLFQRNR